MKGFKIYPHFNTLSGTINLLASELGNVIKEQAGVKYFKLVEDIRVSSKEYRRTNNSKYLNKVYKKLKNLDISNKTELLKNEVVENIDKGTKL